MPALLTRMSIRPSAPLDAFDHRGDGVFVGDIGGHRDGLAAGFFELTDGGERFCLVASDDRDRGAGFSQSPRHAEPDAAIAAGDDGYLA